MSNVEYKPAEKVQIHLVRPTGASWGFRLQGGTDFQTPLSIQSVQANSVAEQCGLKAGDAILTINQFTSDTLSHGEAKEEIMRSGDEIHMLVERGAVKIWKPAVTPMSELKPKELNMIKAATGEEFNPVQKTSLAKPGPPDAPCTIGVAHNRSAQGWGQPKAAVPNVVHAQYNSPMGLYSGDNIAHTYSQQTAGIQQQMSGLDLADHTAGTTLDPSTGQTTGPGFRSVSAPTAKPLSDKTQKPSMRCGDCDMLATGVIVKANGVPYHVACFKCASCSMNLKQKGYFVVNDKLYCETHAKRAVQPPGPDMVATAVYR